MEARVTEELADDVRRTAENAVMLASESGGTLDYSEESLVVIDELLDEASDFVDEMSADAVRSLTESVGCYVLEVGRRAFGGRYLWYEQRDAPVLVVGEPKFRVAMLTWDTVRGRLSGDTSDSIPFLYKGFAQRVRSATDGTDAFYV